MIFLPFAVPPFPMICRRLSARKRYCHYIKKKNFINSFSFLVIFFAYFTMFSSARRKKCRFAHFSVRRRCRRTALYAKNYV